MSTTLMALVTLAYIGVAVSLYLEGRHGMSLAFVGYSVANVGFIYDLMTKGN